MTEGNEMPSYQGKPLTTYEEWLAILGAPSSPTFAEAYRLYEARWRADNPT